MNILLKYLIEKMNQFPKSTICDKTGSISYSELLVYARQNCQMGIASCAKYGILCKSNINTVKAMFCCLFSGATAVVLSDRYGQAHCDKVIEKTKLSHLITDDGIIEIAKRQPEVEDLSDVAYIMCTSGTTGKPKGAMITYENMVANIRDISDYFGVSKTDKILIARPLYHCSAITGELFTALVNGLDIYFCNDGYNPAALLDTIRKYEISVFCCTPTLVYQLAMLAKRQKENLPLKKVAVSGECLNKTVSEKLCEYFPYIDFFNVYGLTEASPRVSYLPPCKFRDNPGSVGFPLNSVLLKVVDNELFVKGSNVMKGYYNDSELTQKAFVNGWLKTGDDAFINEKGLLFIRGRKDDLIIRAGMNVYPQEIENTLKQADGILEALVYGLKTETASEKICIKIVVDKLTKQKVFEICKKLLPKYQLPDVIEIVDELPKNASGKIVRLCKKEYS